MSLTIDLPSELVTRLDDRAKQEGRTPGELAADLLGDSLDDDADAVDAWLRGPVSVTLDKIAAGNGHFHTVDEAENYLARRRAAR